MPTVSTDNTITFNLTPPLFLANLAIRIALLYRKLRFGYPYRRILLTRGKYAIVDPEDFQKLSTQKWHSAKGSSTVYARCSRNNKQLWMHRLIIDVPDHLFVDHINHNGLDNRKANLRPATSAQNNRNARKAKNTECLSKYKGVTWHNSNKKWIAVINIDRKKIHLGCFDNQIKAALAYDNAAIKYHKQFANLNFPKKSAANTLKIKMKSSLALSLRAQRGNLKALIKFITAPLLLLLQAVSDSRRAPNNDKTSHHFPALFLQKILPSNKQIRILFDIIKESCCNFLTILYNSKYEYKRNNAFCSQPGSAQPPRPPPAPVGADTNLFTNLLFFFL